MPDIESKCAGLPPSGFALSDSGVAHGVGAALGVFGWLGFYLAGLPDYYQQYSDATMGLLIAAALVPMVPGAFFGLRYLRGDRRRSHAYFGVVLAGYLALAPALLDWVYLGLGEGHGLSFLTTYWYLTVLYVLPAPFLIGAGLALDRVRPQRSGSR